LFCLLSHVQYDTFDRMLILLRLNKYVFNFFQNLAFIKLYNHFIKNCATLLITYLQLTDDSTSLTLNNVSLRYSGPPRSD